MTSLLAWPRTRPVLRAAQQPIWMILCAITVISIVITQAYGSSMLTVPQLQGIAVAVTALGFVAIGQTVAMLVGSFDLSVAWTVSLSAIVTSTVMDGHTDRIVLGCLAGLGAGALVGLANGLIIAGLRINALIATLATGLLLNGLLSTLVQTRSGSVPGSFRRFGYGSLGPLPVGFMVAMGLAICVGLWLSRSVAGHHLYAVGGSEDVARLSGLRPGRIVVLAHVLCSLCTALAGIYLASRLGAVDPGVGPRGGYDLASVAVVVLGGTVLGGGRGGVGGSIAGVGIFAVIATTFDLLAINPFVKTVLEGCIIVLAVATHSLRARSES